MHKTSHVDQRHDDADKNLETGEEVGQQDQRREEDTDEGQRQVPVQLLHYHLERRKKLRFFTFVCTL